MKRFFAFVLASVAAFSSASAVECREIDNRKGHLFGYKISKGDLFMQPVIVCRFDPDVEVTYTDREKDTQGRYATMKLGHGDVPARAECVNVPSRKIDKKELPGLKKTFRNTAAVYGCPWYEEFGIVDEPENKEKKYPFYYVVGTDGKILYSGCKGTAAVSAAMKDVRKYIESYDKLLGAYKPTVHTELAAKLKFGESIEPVVKKLKPIAAGKKESDARTDAANILMALEQSRTYWYKAMTAAHDPAMKVIIGGQAAKTFPRDKELFMATVQKVLSNPEIAKAVKMFQQIYAYKQKMPEKKADIAKGYKTVCIGEKACIKARKEYGDKLPYAFTSLENLVMEVKAEFEALGCGQK
jgi:hypothetical protein